jgi:hypothetical protein
MAAIGVVQVQTLRANVPGRCGACGATAGFDLEYKQTRAMLLVAPLVAFNAPLEGRCRACGQPAPREAWSAIAKPPLVWRLGWLFFFVAPIVVFGGAYGVYEWFHVKAMRAATQKAAEQAKQTSDTQHEFEQARQDCRASFNQADKAKDACGKDLNDLFRSVTKDVDHERERTPKEHIGTLPVALRGQPMLPKSPLIGDDACPDVVPRDALGYSTADKTCNVTTSPEDIRAIGTKASAAATSKAPDRFVLVTFDCAKTTCETTAAVVDRPSRSLVAVARATKPKTDDVKADKRALAEALAKKLAAWP